MGFTTGRAEKDAIFLSSVPRRAWKAAKSPCITLVYCSGIFTFSAFTTTELLAALGREEAREKVAFILNLNPTMMS